MAFFKKFTEKASAISSIAKEYYDEGIHYASKELEKEKSQQKLQKRGEEFKEVEDIQIKKTNSNSQVKANANLDELSSDNNDEDTSENIETLDGDTDTEALKEYEILLENARKRDETYQELIKENEYKIIELSDTNKLLTEKIMDLEGKLEQFKPHKSQAEVSKTDFKKLSDISQKLKQFKEDIDFNLFTRKDPDSFGKICMIKKAIAMAKTKAVLAQNAKLQERVANQDLEIDDLKHKLENQILKDRKVKSLEKKIAELEALKGNEAILKKENDEQKLKISRLNEELEEIRKNKDILVEHSTSTDETINKFKEFWDFILMDHEKVLNNLDKNIPSFKSLFNKLDANEKQRFKPILQIVAHSLQFLKKIVSLDESYNFIANVNETYDMVNSNDHDKAELLQKQLSIMQDECTKLREREAHSKQRIREIEKDLKQLGEIEEYKKEKDDLAEELEETKERFETIVRESKEYKQQLLLKTNQLKENEKLIEGLNFKVMKALDTESKLDDALAQNDKLRTEIDQKEHEIQMTLADYKNIQEALDEINESSQLPQVEEKPIVKNTDKDYKKKYEAVQDKLSDLLPKVEMVEKYKVQIEELCKANIDLKSRYKEMERNMTKKIEKESLEYLKSKNLVDSAMINTFLVQYLRHGDDPAIQRQMLLAMSGILNFTEKEKQIIGLVEKDENFDNIYIGAKFIDFISENEKFGLFD
ncbi:unnamed protein product [Moneuplotes crassus]|uniref:GRIP domain-containing protein n=2 Tax=Euplotes crassus TaxID=5936 RepID=A0AAD1YAT9_EUPCR|nr:unnamed protein product [Moneuplotes crassus]